MGSFYGGGWGGWVWVGVLVGMMGEGVGGWGLGGCRLGWGR